MKRHAIIFWTVMIFAAVGLVDSLLRNWITFLIPAALIVLVYVLYKYPPKRYGKGPKIKPSAKTASKMAAANRRSSSSFTPSSGGKRKHYPFQVIEGQKGKNDNDQPKYH